MPISSGYSPFLEFVDIFLHWLIGYTFVTHTVLEFALDLQVACYVHKVISIIVLWNNVKFFVVLLLFSKNVWHL